MDARCETVRRIREAVFKINLHLFRYLLFLKGMNTLEKALGVWNLVGKKKIIQPE